MEAAEKMLADDVAANKAIGAYGVEAILEALKDKKDANFSVLTHCNTGRLLAPPFSMSYFWRYGTQP